MNTVYKQLNGIQTSLLIWNEPFSGKHKDIIVCVSGNPGVVDFYTEFGQVLYDSTKLPVCIIGQAGHEEDVYHRNVNLCLNQKSLYNLEGQVAHKLDLVLHSFDKECKLHLIGHSIGAWQIIEMINKHPELTNRISSINLLFPTIQKMADSPNGKSLNSVVRRIPNVILLLLKILQILPSFITTFLIYVYLYCHSLPFNYFKRIKKLLNPAIMENVLFLAFDEMDTVTHLNKDSIEKVKHLTYVIYSDRDNWAPLSFIEDLKVFTPDMQLEETQVEHAFVLKSSKMIAVKVAKFIKSKLANFLNFKE